MRRQYSISPADVDCAATNIAAVRDGQRSAMVDAIVIYDATHGSLRLSEPAYTNLGSLIERLKTAVSMTPEKEDLLPPEVLKALEAWFRKLEPEADDLAELLRTADSDQGRPGWLQVYAPGSMVCRRNVQGLLTDIEIVEPELTTVDEGPFKLFYRYKSRAGVRALTPADQVQPAGDQWSYKYWNPETGEYAEEVDDLVVRSIDRPISLSDSIAGSET
jgi:hypothetical protein